MIKTQDLNSNWRALVIMRASEAGFLLLPGVFLLLTLLSGRTTYAQSRCEKAPVRGCVTSFADIAREQVKMNSHDSSINLRTSVTNIFREVNGKDLVLNYFGQQKLRIDFGAASVRVALNGVVANNLELCYEACPLEGKPVTWFNKKHGEFSRIRGGIKVGSHNFLVPQVEQANR